MAAAVRLDVPLKRCVIDIYRRRRPAAAMTLRADRVVYDEDEGVMEASGNVRLKLDTPSEQVQ